MQSEQVKKQLYDKITKGEWEVALKKIRQIENKETLDWNVSYWAGMCSYMLKDLVSACSYYKNTVKMINLNNPALATILNALGVAQQESNKLSEAVRTFKKSIKLFESLDVDILNRDDTLQNAHYSLAITYGLQANEEVKIKKGNDLDSLALDHYFQALKLEGDSIEAKVPSILEKIKSNIDGQKLFEQGNVEAVVLRKLRYDNKRFTLYMSSFASQFFKMGHYNEAMKWIKTALSYIDENHSNWNSINEALKRIEKESA